MSSKSEFGWTGGCMWALLYLYNYVIGSVPRTLKSKGPNSCMGLPWSIP
ncbi:hypothetical protein LINPERHAP1_LOCUS20162, partial [Linum perenne]